MSVSWKAFIDHFTVHAILQSRDAMQHGVNLISAQSIPGQTDPLDWLKIPITAVHTLIAFFLVLWYCDQGICHLDATLYAKESYLLAVIDYLIVGVQCLNFYLAFRIEFNVHANYVHLNFPQEFYMYLLQCVY